MQRSVGHRLPTHPLQPGEPIEHPEIDVVGVGLGDLREALGAVGDVVAEFMHGEFDRGARARWVFESDGLGHERSMFAEPGARSAIPGEYSVFGIRYSRAAFESRYQVPSTNTDSRDDHLYRSLA
jgi:hypothetical protein